MLDIKCKHDSSFSPRNFSPVLYIAVTLLNQDSYHCFATTCAHLFPIPGVLNQNQTCFVLAIEVKYMYNQTILYCLAQYNGLFILWLVHTSAWGAQTPITLCATPSVLIPNKHYVHKQTSVGHPQFIQIWQCNKSSPGMSSSLFTGVLADGYGPPPDLISGLLNPIMVRNVHFCMHYHWLCVHLTV